MLKSILDFSEPEITTDASMPDAVEAKKTVILKDFRSLLAWHFWVTLPCLATVVLLYLNISEHVVGTEVGKTQKGTQNIIDALQVAAKAYEVICIICLVNIVQQWIQRSLIGEGTLLGLLCVEQSFSNILFLNSKEFLSAIGYGIRRNSYRGNETPEQHRQRKRVLFFAAFLAFVCLLSAVIGPASAVLMIPQMGLFFESNEDWIPPAEQDLRSQHQCHSYIMMDTRLGTGVFTLRRLDDVPIPDYWRYAWFLKDPRNSKLLQEFYTHQQHIFTNIGLPTVVNYTATWGRPLILDANWSGSSKFTTAVRPDVRAMCDALIDYKPIPKNKGSKGQYVVNMSGIEAHTVCRRRRKVPCKSANDSEWCFMHVTIDGDQGELLSSRDLLLMIDYSWGGENVAMMLPRVWMTEGPRSKNRRFTDSIVFVIEDFIQPPTPEPLLTVCSVTSTLRSVTAISPDRLYSPQQLQFFDYLNYFESTPGTPGPPRTFLYHENWLDWIHEVVVFPNGTITPVLLYGNHTYQPRAELKPTENNFLKPWVVGIQSATSYTGDPLWWPSGDTTYVEATEIEMIVGGAFISLLSRKTRVSNSQYPMSYVKSDIERISMTQTYSEELMPEPSILCQSKYTPIAVYREVYGFQSRSSVGILSMVVLVVFMLVALLGSVWQYRKRDIIDAWYSFPAYAALCLGTSTELGTITNTSAGISLKETMNTLVKVRATVDTPHHLELITSPSATQENLIEVGSDGKY